MYRDYAETAEKKAFYIAKLFRNVGEVERHHDFRFRQLAENLRNGEVFCKEEEVWVCLNWGYVHFEMRP
ncbi:MAG: ferritin family protein [Eisenbergiella massiliensis]